MVFIVCRWMRNLRLELKQLKADDLPAFHFFSEDLWQCISYLDTSSPSGS
jgi:hypothetical protein